MSSSGTVATQPPSASNSFISIHLYWPTRAAVSSTLNAPGSSRRSHGANGALGFLESANWSPCDSAPVR